LASGGASPLVDVAEHLKLRMRVGLRNPDVSASKGNRRNLVRAYTSPKEVPRARRGPLVGSRAEKQRLSATDRSFRFH
jgi:hypothetical protein